MDIEEAFKGKSEEEIQQAYNHAITVLMSIEMLAVVGIYLLLKNFCPAIASEIFIMFISLYYVKRNADLSKKIYFKDVLKEIKHEEKETEEGKCLGEQDNYSSEDPPEEEAG